MAQAVTLRRWRKEDCKPLAELANNRKIWLNLRDRLPFPYTTADAEDWIAHCASEEGPSTQFAIEADGQLTGGIGFEALSDVNRLGAEIGYWIGEPFWGRGIATAALIEASQRAFADFPFERLQAMVFAWNAASMRVLEKAGYQLEGRLRRSVIKDSRIIDSLIYARLRS
ncbi:MAG TPA: GNAT family protein [Candidatus Binataceae bacterium]|nr:GNAT family protein [Candidatus Binataceae bacterium]